MNRPSSRRVYSNYWERMVVVVVVVVTSETVMHKPSSHQGRGKGCEGDEVSFC